jgi:ferredoxin--NADP+ reductase
MIDGVGMCGTCRVSIDGETKFACIDGPEFDAHTVNFNELMNRLRVYSTAEKVALEVYEKKQKVCHEL